MLLSSSAPAGGYYIAAAAPEARIFAQPATITGSIGVITIKPYITDLLASYGLQVGVCRWWRRRWLRCLTQHAYRGYQQKLTRGNSPQEEGSCHGRRGGIMPRTAR